METFLNHAPPPLRYSYSRLAWLYIHKLTQQMGSLSRWEMKVTRNFILLTYLRSVFIFIKQYSDFMCFLLFVAENYESYLIYDYGGNSHFGTQRNNASATFFLDLLLSIRRDGTGQLRSTFYEKRDDYNFHITNFPFVGSNIPFSPAYCGFFHSLHDMQGLAPLMHVLFWGRRDVHLSFSSRDISGNFWNRLLRSSMVHMGISLFTIWSFPHRNVAWQSEAWPSWHPSMSRHFTH